MKAIKTLLILLFITQVITETNINMLIYKDTQFKSYKFYTKENYRYLESLNTAETAKDQKGLVNFGLELGTYLILKLSCSSQIGLLCVITHENIKTHLKQTTHFIISKQEEYNLMLANEFQATINDWPHFIYKLNQRYKFKRN